MSIDKTGSVRWEGRGKVGVGHVSTGTGALTDYPYGYASRFEGKPGTNPEELVGAAHASCFTMMFSFLCDAAGFESKSVKTRSEVRLTQSSEGFAIGHIALTLEAVVPGMDEGAFQLTAAKAKAQCPVSKALAGVSDITLTATLI